MPLFWRVDIDIRANSVAADDLYDVGNPDARSEAGWSGPASAIENAIAAIKAAVRGQADTADVLLRRGCERIGRDPGPTADLAGAITSLADDCAAQERGLTSMAAEVHQVVAASSDLPVPQMADPWLYPARLADSGSVIGRCIQGALPSPLG